MGKEKSKKSKSSKTSSKASASATNSKHKSTREKNSDELTKKSKRKHSPSPTTPEKIPKIQETEGLFIVSIYVSFKSVFWLFFKHRAILATMFLLLT